MAAEKLSGGEHTTVTITTTTYSAIDRLAAHPNSSNIENHFHRRRAEKSSTEGHVNGFFRKSDRNKKRTDNDKYAKRYHHGDEQAYRRRRG